jgi:hypothetical protein
VAATNFCCFFLREDDINSLQGHPRSVACRPVLLEENPVFLLLLVEHRILQNVHVNLCVDSRAKKYRFNDARPLHSTPNTDFFDPRVAAHARR